MKINSKSIQDLNVRAKTIKFLEEKREKLSDTGSGRFFGYDAKSIGINNKTDKLNYIKILNFCASKYTNNRVKGNPEKGRKNVQIIHLIRDYYPDYIKNTSNSTTKNKQSE